jgi:hypothetical protein
MDIAGHARTFNKAVGNLMPPLPYVANGAKATVAYPDTPLQFSLYALSVQRNPLRFCALRVRARHFAPGTTVKSGDSTAT